MPFKIGDTVSFLDEEGEGKIIELIGSDKAIVKDETGFNKKYPLHSLVEIHGRLEDIQTVMIKDDNQKFLERVGQSVPRGVTVQKDHWEMDLHSHNIMDSEKGLSNGQILAKQMYEFKRFFNRATEKYIRKLIVIHGVGEGVLKSEIHSFLNGKDDVTYFDADFCNYGKGATEIIIHYSS